MNTDKINQGLMFVSSIVGTIYVAINNIEIQIIGFLLWIIADIMGCYIFYKKGMWITFAQFFVYIWIVVFGLMERLA